MGVAKTKPARALQVASIALSREKKTRKAAVEWARLVAGSGLEGDAHAGSWHRQVSFLAAESIERAGEGGSNLAFGDFAENIATRGVDWNGVAVGQRLRIGESAIVEITQIGKACHGACEIYRRLGDCIMPREGVFGKVLRGGDVRIGDVLAFIDDQEAIFALDEENPPQGDDQGEKE